MHSYIEGIRSRSATPVSAKMTELMEGKTSMEEELHRLQRSIENIRTRSGTPIDWTAINAEVGNGLVLKYIFLQLGK